MEDKHLDFYLNLYAQERERSVNLEQSLNIPIGLQSGLFVLFFFFLNEFESGASQILNLIFFGFLTISFLISLFAVFFLFKSYANPFKVYKFSLLPKASELHQYFIESKEYYEQYQSAYPSIPNPDIAFNEMLKIRLIESLDCNFRNNNLKSEYLHTAKRYLFWSLIALFISSIPFGIVYFNKAKPNIESVIENQSQIDNHLIELIKQIKNEQERKSSSLKPDTTASTTTAPRSQNAE